MHKEAFDWGAISSAAGEGDRSGRQGAADKGRVLALMLQTINDPFLLVDQAARIEEVNEAMAQRVGISRTRLLGANSLAFLTPDKRRQFKQHIHALLQGLVYYETAYKTSGTCYQYLSHKRTIKPQAVPWVRRHRGS